MLFTRWTAPDRSLPAAEVHAGFDAHPDETLLFAFTTDRMTVCEHEGAFSLKFVTHGREEYRIGRRRVVLAPGRVLLTNAGQSYASSIETPRTRAISSFLPHSVVDGVARSLVAQPEAQLERSSPPGVEVLPVPFRPDPALAVAVSRLATAADAIQPSPCLLEELVLESVTRALGQWLNLACPGAFPASMRRSTREELVTRVLRARDLIEDTGGRVTLARMADAACLSRYHFLRVFRAVVGLTPALFARRVRLARGAARLARGEPTRVAARAAGFASASTFLRSVRRA